MSLADALKKNGIENVERESVGRYLSTGYAPLDKILAGSYRNGGFAQGRIHEVSGPPSAGKTAIATFTMANAQKAAGVATFKDHERSFETQLAETLGLDLDPNKWIYRTPLTFEESLDQAVEIAHLVRDPKNGVDPDAPLVMVFDSLASMVPKSKWDKTAKDYNMNDNTALARATSAAFPAFAQHCEQSNITALFLNQIRTKIGVMYGDPTSTPGGQSMEFYASQRLRLSRSMIVNKAEKTTEGQRITAKTIKNKVYRPHLAVEWDFLFTAEGKGKFDIVGGTIDALVSEGIIEQAGNYLVWDGKKYYRSALIPLIEANGEVERLLDMLPEDPE